MDMYASQTQIKVAKVSQAKLFESYRTLPKYSHVHAACINPSPKKIRPREQRRAHSLDIEADRVKIKPKPNMMREIPSHLAKPHVEPSA